MSNIQSMQRGKKKFFGKNKKKIISLSLFMLLIMSCTTSKESFMMYYDIKGDVDSYIILNKALCKFNYEKYIPVRNEIISCSGRYESKGDTIILIPLYGANFDLYSYKIDSFDCAYEYYGNKKVCVDKFIFVREKKMIKNETLLYWFPMDSMAGCFENESEFLRECNIRLNHKQKRILNVRNSSSDYFSTINNLK